MQFNTATVHMYVHIQLLYSSATFLRVFYCIVLEMSCSIV